MRNAIHLIAIRKFLLSGKTKGKECLCCDVNVGTVNMNSLLCLQQNPILSSSRLFIFTSGTRFTWEVLVKKEDFSSPRIP